MAYNGLLGSGQPKPSLARALMASGQQSAPPPVVDIAPMAAPDLGMQQGPAYGSDEWALNTGGPGAMVARELMRGLASGDLSALDPKSGFFSGISREALGPPYSKKGKG